MNTKWSLQFHLEWLKPKRDTYRMTPRIELAEIARLVDQKHTQYIVKFRS